MYKQLIIISKDKYELSNIDYLVLNECKLIDNNSLSYNNELYYFDYLIIDDLSITNNIDLQMNNNKVITNYYNQTSIDNIFAVGEITESNINKYNQVNDIIEALINNEI